MSSLTPGSSAPDFTLPPIAGHSPQQLSSLRGQPVLLAFSPSGWDPSRAEGLAQINRILEQTGFSGELLSLSPGEPAAQAMFAGERSAIPVLTNAQLTSDAAALYGVPDRQALFVLDEAGMIRWSYVAAPGTAPRAEELLAGLSALAVKSELSSETVSARPLASSDPRQAVLSRRQFLAAALGVALVLAVPTGSAQAKELPSQPPAPLPPPLVPPSPVGTVPVTLHVNGTAHALQLEPRVSLLDALRERIGLTGSKKGCDHGQCGACTVLADGKRINSCLALAVAYQSKEITTIEGLAHGETLHPVQAAFIQHDGFQCGFCTPGQIMSGVALLTEPVGPEDDDVRENMSGNICRCGAYPNIVAAIQDVRKGASNAPV